MDTRAMADQLGRKHQNVYEMVKDYQADFEQLGKVRFETGPLIGSKTGQKEKFALLNEDQCYLLLTFPRNTAKV
ncbi:Rha family transcriptional regulator, partial [Escherichia coli]|uniref:Rha family transcriptional regulator n=1 Tax=Escherichia coli TaxID=562 RepID=UPI0039E0E854